VVQGVSERMNQRTKGLAPARKTRRREKLRRKR
jgi:hypothetical protein